MANYEYTDNVGVWFFHSLITSAKLDGMAINEEANHQNKPRTCHQYESTWQVTGEGEGEFIEISHLQPEHTVLLFGVHVVDTNLFPTGEADSSSEHFIFPTGAGIGPFLRPAVITLCTSSFAVPDASGGADWQTASVAAATDESGPGDWLLAALGIPFTASGLDNFKAGVALYLRIAGFDGQGTAAPPANSNFYVFWHATGPVAAYS